MFCTPFLSFSYPWKEFGCRVNTKQFGYNFKIYTDERHNLFILTEDTERFLCYPVYKLEAEVPPVMEYL